MCPLCLTSLALTVTTTTGIGAAALSVAARASKSLANRSPRHADPGVPETPAAPARGGR